jgi:hypothetical protein
LLRAASRSRNLRPRRRHAKLMHDAQPQRRHYLGHRRVISRRWNGLMFLIDGWHRRAVACHLGLTHLPGK